MIVDYTVTLLFVHFCNHQWNLFAEAGDVAFVRHLTVRDNTDGRNQAIWSRNRRSDDYEIMCKDGRRTAIDNWEKCYIGTVPSNAVVTAGESHL